MRKLPLIGAALLLVLAGQAAVSGPAAATVAATALASTLTKSAQNLTSPGANPANHGDVINWVLSYDSDAAPGAATLSDAIQGAPASQEYLLGSLKVPPGWTPRWSTDGTTFGGTEPASGTTAVRATNPNARPGGTNLTQFLRVLLGDSLRAAVVPTGTGGTGGPGRH